MVIGTKNGPADRVPSGSCVGGALSGSMKGCVFAVLVELFRDAVSCCDMVSISLLAFCVECEDVFWTADCSERHVS